MVRPTLYLLQLVVQLVLKDLVLIGLQLLETLVFLEGGDVLPQLVDEGSGAVLDEVVYCY